MRVGIFGGSFDPVHHGHLRAAQWALEAFLLDRILLIPARQSPFKAACFAPDQDRHAMLRLAARDNPSFAVDDCELRREAPSYTVDTLRQLAEREPLNQWTVIVGSDAGLGLPGWRDVAEVQKLAEIRILGRPGDPESARVDGFVYFPGLGISSTELRESVRAGRSVRYLTPESVRLYIEEKGLYK